MSNLEEGGRYFVRYISLEGETTERTILPVEIPTKNVKAVDISDFHVEDQGEIQNLYRQYQEYRETFTKRMFSFQDWVEHSTGVVMDLKYRTFVPENLELLDE